ncbi:MAG: hypothetical protein ACYTE1_10650 [Planctomycetota bacterium]|jgi:hypothetical protein
MNHDQLSFLNPNYFHGCHPFDLRSYFESDPFFETLDSAFPFQLPRVDSPHPKASFRQQVLERLLKNISSPPRIWSTSATLSNTCVISTGATAGQIPFGCQPHR